LFANCSVPADDFRVTDHVDAFTKQICEVIVGKNPNRDHVLESDAPVGSSINVRIYTPSRHGHLDPAWAIMAGALPMKYRKVGIGLC
jgi:hypothetical protein